MPPKKSPQSKSKPASASVTKMSTAATLQEDAASTQLLPPNQQEKQHENNNNNNEKQQPSPAKKMSSTQQPQPTQNEETNGTQQQGPDQTLVLPPLSSLPFIAAIPRHVQRFISKVASPTGKVEFHNNNNNNFFVDVLREAATSKQGLLGTSLDLFSSQNNHHHHHSVHLQHGNASNAASVTSCLCSLGFHLVGTAPLFSTTNSTGIDNAVSLIEPDDRVEDDAMECNNNNNNKSNKNEITTRRRQRQADDDDDGIDGINEQKNDDDDDDTSAKEFPASDSTPLPPSQWIEEVMQFPSCSHSVCRTCALHHFTLQLLVNSQNNKNNKNNNEAQNLTLECSFCASKGNSSCLTLEIEPETESENVEASLSCSSLSEKINRLLQSDSSTLSPEIFKSQNESPKSACSISWKLFLVNSWEKYHEKIRKQKLESQEEDDDAAVIAEDSNQNNDHNSTNNNIQISLTQQNHNMCGVCEETQGSNWCYDCGFALCQDCLKSVHSKGKFKKHDVVDGIPATSNNSVQQIPASPATSVVSAANRASNSNIIAKNNAILSSDLLMMFSNNQHCSPSSSLSLINCPLHPNYPIELFCSDCSKTACLMCHFAGSHKNHKVSPLTEVQQKAQQDIQSCCNSLMVMRMDDQNGSNSNHPFFNNNFSSVLSARSDVVSTCADDVLSLCDEVFEKIHETVAQRKKKIVERINTWRRESQSVAQDDFVILSWAAESMKNILESCKPVFSGAHGDDEQNNNKNDNHSIKDKGALTADTLLLRDAVKFRVENLLSSSLVQQLNELVLTSNTHWGGNITFDNNNLPMQRKSQITGADDNDNLTQKNQNPLFVSLMNQILLRSHKNSAVSQDSSTCHAEEILLADDDDDDDDNEVSAEKQLVPFSILPSLCDNNRNNSQIVDARLCPSFKVGLEQIESALENFLSTQAETKLVLPEWNSFLQMILEIRRDRNEQKIKNEQQEEIEKQQQQQHEESSSIKNKQQQHVVHLGSEEKNVMAEMIETRRPETNNNNHNNIDNSNVVVNRKSMSITKPNNSNENSIQHCHNTRNNDQPEESSFEDSHVEEDESVNSNNNNNNNINNMWNAFPPQVAHRQQQLQQPIMHHNSLANNNSFVSPNANNGRQSFQIQLQQQIHQEPNVVMDNTTNNQIGMRQQQQQQQPPPGFMAPTFNQARQGLMLPSSLKNATYQQRPTTSTAGVNQNSSNSNQQQQQQQQQQQKKSNFSLHLGGGK